VLGNRGDRLLRGKVGQQEGRDFAEGAASFRNCASQIRYKHPWGAKSDASAILFLPCFERGFFQIERGAHRNDVMGELAVQTLAMGCEFAFRVGVLSPSRLVPLALLPATARFAVFLDTSLLVIVLRVIGVSLPLQLALEAS
jgi:hypothetical protein